MKTMLLKKGVWCAMILHLVAIMVYPHVKPARHFSSEQFKVKAIFYRNLIILLHNGALLFLLEN